MQNFTKLQEPALIVLRLVVGAIFLWAGYAKLTFWSGVPEGMQMTAGMLNLTKFLSIVEPLGGAALIAGFLTRWAATGLAIIMVGAFFILKFMMQAPFFTGPQGSGLDYITLIFAGCFALMAFGPGKWSVDAVWKKA